MIATAHKVWVPSLSHFVHFQNRPMMHRGHPKRTFRMKGAMPTPPATVDWSSYKGTALSFPIDGNDNYGDCMYAAAAHADNTFTGMNGSESSFDVNTLIKDYLRLSGGDNGLDEESIISEWKKGICSDPKATILDAIDVDPTNTDASKLGVYLFGGLFFMLDVPDNWINNFDTGAIWDTSRPDSGNGHGVFWNGYDNRSYFRLLTWGSYVWITPGGVKTCDPAGFLVFSLRWFNSQGFAPNGMHYTQLAPLWQQLGGAQLPPSPFPAPGPGPIPVTTTELIVNAPIQPGTYLLPDGQSALDVATQNLGVGHYALVPSTPPPPPPPAPGPIQVGTLKALLTIPIGDYPMSGGAGDLNLAAPIPTGSYPVTLTPLSGPAPAGVSVATIKATVPVGDRPLGPGGIAGDFNVTTPIPPGVYSISFGVTPPPGPGPTTQTVLQEMQQALSTLQQSISDLTTISAK